MRLDRIITKSRGEFQIDLNSPVALFADSPVNAEGTPDYLFPSDHFGLISTLTFTAFIEPEKEVEQPTNTCLCF